MAMQLFCAAVKFLGECGRQTVGRILPKHGPQTKPQQVQHCRGGVPGAGICHL